MSDKETAMKKESMGIVDRSHPDLSLSCVSDLDEKYFRKTFVHLMLIRGGTRCGAVGEMNTDIDLVTCPECRHRG